MIAAFVLVTARTQMGFFPKFFLSLSVQLFSSNICEMHSHDSSSNGKRILSFVDKTV